MADMDSNPLDDESGAYIFRCGVCDDCSKYRHDLDASLSGTVCKCGHSLSRHYRSMSREPSAG